MMNKERILGKLNREIKEYKKNNKNDTISKKTYVDGRYYMANEILKMIENNVKQEKIMNRLDLEIMECEEINESEGGLTDFGRGGNAFAEELLELITSLQSVKDKSKVINELRKDILELEHMDEFENDLNEYQNGAYNCKVEMLKLLIDNEKEETIESLEKRLKKLKAKKYNYVIFDKIVNEEITKIINIEDDLRNKINVHINPRATYRVSANRIDEKTIVVKIFNYVTGELEGKGKSICHDEDKFNLELGCKIAQIRAKANLYKRISNLY